MSCTEDKFDLFKRAETETQTFTAAFIQNY